MISVTITMVISLFTIIIIFIYYIIDTHAMVRKLYEKEFPEVTK